MPTRFRFLSILIPTIALAMPAVAQGNFVILIGSPASGKTTQADLLKRDLGMTVIAADDLIAHNRDRFERYEVPVLNGVSPRLDPAMDGLVEDALKKADMTKGVVLDGYPASKTQGDFLLTLRGKLNLPKAVVIHLQVPDEEVRKRLSEQKVAAADIDQQLKDYHREFDFASLYFPDTKINMVEATKPPEVVFAEIRKLIAAEGSAK